MNCNDTVTRLNDAKQFLIENPLESKICAARIFDIPRTTLQSSLAQNSASNEVEKRGGHNKILEKHQIKAIYEFIRSLLTYGVQPTHELIFNAIKSLKRSQNADYKGPTKRWFRTWWKSNHLHKIKTKPLPVVRYTAGQVKDVKAWFADYRVVLRELNIKNKRNIINLDEAGFRVCCMKGLEILVPTDVKEYYSISPENRKSITIFENINAAGDYPPPPLLVIQGHDMMSNWFADEMPKGTRIVSSENGFTSDKIAIAYLQHYIENSDAGPESDWKLMLMDNHGSHVTPEFIRLANENRIRPYPLIPHLTHCMQPLDVGVFQPYKHWHDVAIQDAIAEFNVEYTITRFCQDLTKIRDNTFKKSTTEYSICL